MSTTLDKTKNTTLAKAKLIAKKQLANLSDEKDSRLTAAALADLDNPPLEEQFFKTAKRGRPFMEDGEKKVPVTIRLDPDVVAHFKADGKGWQGKMNEALRKVAGL